MQTLINQRKIEFEKMQSRLLWRKYSSVIMLCVVTITSCAFTIHKLMSSGIIPGLPDDKTKTGLTFSLDDAVLIGAIGILSIIFITLLSLYINQKYKIKKFKSGNDFVKFARDYGELEKIKSFLSETIELRNSSIATAVFSKIASEAFEKIHTGNSKMLIDVNETLRARQNNIQGLINHIRMMIPKVPVSETKNYEQLAFILEKVNSLLAHYTGPDGKRVPEYVPFLKKTSFSHIYQLLDQKDDKKDHVKILNEAYQYVQTTNNMIGIISTQKQKIKDKVFFKTKKKDDLYHVFEAISKSMVLEESITSQNENGNSTEVVQRHLADAHHLVKQRTGSMRDAVISCLDDLNSESFDYNEITNKLNDELKDLTKKTPENTKYITQKFNSQIQESFELMANTILDRDTSKIAIQKLYEEIESRNNPGAQSSSTGLTIEPELQNLIMNLAEKLLDDEIEFAKVHDSTLDLSEESVIYSILKDKLSEQLDTRLEDIFHAQLESSQHPDHHESMPDVSSMNSANSIQTLQKDTQHKK